MKNIIALLLLILGLGHAEITAQTPLTIHLETVNTNAIGGLQSYAVGQANGKWLIIGGRLDGLHRRQPWASFDIAGHNNQLIVFDPVSLQKWTTALTSLPQSMQEQLSSTNMNFFQEDDMLYVVGGYGYSATAGDHTTFPYLTAIDVPAVIDAVVNNTSFTSSFRQITDNQFQVTGGRLQKVYDTYYLLGGQKFIGKYNPMGPNNGPGFIQEYTNAIRKFKITDDGLNLTITHLPAHVDAANLHRRDYNAEPQILPNGEQGVTMFSGVFQQNVNLPFLNSVTVDTNGYGLEANFQQYYNHYHCPVIPLYNATTNEMHTLFFGGIAQYYDSAGVLVQDNNVPFVNTIARVTRDANGAMTEYKLPLTLPALMGSGAEFIADHSLAHYSNQVLQLHNITADTTFLGYIYGGIQSSAPNIFFVNDGTQSVASHQIFKVYLIQGEDLSVHTPNKQSNSTLQMRMYPNPNKGLLKFDLFSATTVDLEFTLYSLDGKIVHQEVIKNVASGNTSHLLNLNDKMSEGVYFAHLSTGKQHITQKLILRR
ncbi:Por secretion system C-terminal sorting domain-containing protein [Lishizhenia tianjinensis]|uniref:Por secretion system C-terminal sorting domain-containing protein n=1 Tax=Lishizhenia tianjinensis TaxID=477690 RepID=A0A1I6ZR17_9FLAO|nr:T9SS type A sorting domain-containing protein [Lishizhenia tianjinensis]SFT65110.1 Por secretion system C-terminal sorting domain-containing protein [Lishizhenia tianjinensis]